MKKVFYIVNALVLVGVLLFANVALTIHHFDHHPHAHDNPEHQHPVSSDDDCPVCDFDFAAIALFGQIIRFEPFVDWQTTKNDHIPFSAFQAVPESKYLRGPPELM